MHIFLLFLGSPAIFLGFIIVGEIFAYVTIFNPTIEVVTFHLHGWCMLGVFLLPAFTHLGHECQDLLSCCDGKHVCTDKTSVYTFIRKSLGGGNGVRTHVNSKGKSSLLEKILPRGGSNLQCCTEQDSEPSTLPTTYCGPPLVHMNNNKV